MKLPFALSLVLPIFFINSSNGFNNDSLPDARPAIRAIYKPVPTANSHTPDFSNPVYYPFHLYWEWEQFSPSRLLLPETASDYELLALSYSSSAPQYAVTIRGNRLHWGAAAGSCPADAYAYSYSLYPGWLEHIVQSHINTPFPSEKRFSWLHPFIDFQQTQLTEIMEESRRAEYGNKYVYRGVTVLPLTLVQELKSTWRECLETAVLDLPMELFECCDQDYCFYSTIPGLIATEQRSCRRVLPLKCKMFHLFRALFDATSMNDMTPQTQHMLMKLCSDARKIAGEMKQKPPAGLRWQDFTTTFYPPYPEDGERCWEGKTPPLIKGGSPESTIGKEFWTLPLSSNPAWKDLFPNSPENAADWMTIHSEGLCQGAFIHQGVLHTAITYLSLPFYRTHDFSGMNNPPSLNPYELWWNGEEMRIRRFFLKLDPSAEKELKTYLNLISRYQKEKNREGNPFGKLFSKKTGHNAHILQVLDENVHDETDSFTPNFTPLDDACLFWISGATDYLQEGSGQLKSLREARKELEDYMARLPSTGEKTSAPAGERDEQKP